MKKNGFTLAEVLITLSIIGVVASLTLPSLMSNTGEQQMVTAYKKVLNSLSEAGQMNAALDGYDYSSAVGKGAAGNLAENTATIMGIFDSRLNIASTTTGSTMGNCTSPLFLRDGSALCTGSLGSTASTGGYYTMIVDVNGTKGPNRFASCASSKGCTSKSAKLIYDQFYVTLYQGNAIAGKWNAVNTLDNTSASYAAEYAAGLTGK